MVCTSMLSPSRNHFWRCGSEGLTKFVKMESGARPSIFASRSRIGRRNASYFAGCRMSSIDNTMAASTPGSPIHCGVTSFGADVIEEVARDLQLTGEEGEFAASPGEPSEKPEKKRGWLRRRRK